MTVCLQQLYKIHSFSFYIWVYSAWLSTGSTWPRWWQRQYSQESDFRTYLPLLGQIVFHLYTQCVCMSAHIRSCGMHSSTHLILFYLSLDTANTMAARESVVFMWTPAGPTFAIYTSQWKVGSWERRCYPLPCRVPPWRPPWKDRCLR